MFQAWRSSSSTARVTTSTDSTATTSPSPGPEPPVHPLPRSISAPEPQQPQRNVSYLSRPSLAPPLHSYCGYESPSELEDGYITPDPTHHRPGLPGAASGPAWLNSSTSRRQNAGGNNSSQEASMDDILNKGRNLSKRKVSLRDRISCYQWTWFAMTMATGGVANVLYSSRSNPSSLISTSKSRKKLRSNVSDSDQTTTVPYRSQWLTGVGLFFFFLNLTLFAVNCTCITLRFLWSPGSFLHSLNDQTESLFVSSIVSSISCHSTASLSSLQR